jgi:hypothetical protein
MAKKKNIRLRNNKGQFISKAKEQIIRSIAKEQKVSAKNLAKGKTKIEPLNNAINQLIFKNQQSNNNINADRLYNKIETGEIKKFRLNGEKINKKEFLFELKKLQNHLSKNFNSPFFTIANTIDATDGVYNFKFPTSKDLNKLKAKANRINKNGSEEFETGEDFIIEQLENEFDLQIFIS